MTFTRKMGLDLSYGIGAVFMLVWLVTGARLLAGIGGVIILLTLLVDIATRPPAPSLIYGENGRQVTPEELYAVRDRPQKNRE